MKSYQYKCHYHTTSNLNMLNMKFYLQKNWAKRWFVALKTTNWSILHKNDNELLWSYLFNQFKVTALFYKYYSYQNKSKTVPVEQFCVASFYPVAIFSSGWLPWIQEELTPARWLGVGWRPPAVIPHWGDGDFSIRSPVQTTFVF